jgi:hypothetical protein
VNVVLAVAAVVAVIIYVIGRQLRGEPLRAKRVLVLPAVLAVVGLVDLSGSKGVNAADIVCIIASALMATGIGVAQGAKMRLELRDGGLWDQMPVRSLWLWGALILSRVAVTVVAVPLGAHIASSTGSILLVLGLNRLAQAAVIKFARPRRRRWPAAETWNLALFSHVWTNRAVGATATGPASQDEACRPGRVTLGTGDPKVRSDRLRAPRLSRTSVNVTVEGDVRCHAGARANDVAGELSSLGRRRSAVGGGFSRKGG